MSMLAERKKKVKWTLNPGRREIWKTDDSEGLRFGKGLMEKMGWKVGQGLGANKQGITEPLKVSYKSDNKGMGYKENEDEWMQQQQDFDQLLSKLSSNNNNATSDNCSVSIVNSLEEKSKSSKARVHYQKFTRGKDLSRYSKKDLECIVGSKTTSSKSPGTMEEKDDNPSEYNSGLTIINSGSMADYFAKKLLKKKNADHNDQNYDKTEEECTENNENNNENHVDLTGNSHMLKKENSRRKNELKETEGVSELVRDNDSPENGQEFHEFQKKEKRKKKDKSNVEESIINDDLTEDVSMLNAGRLQDETSENCHENQVECGKTGTKKKRKKKLDDVEREIACANENEVREKEKQKKKRFLEETGNGGGIINDVNVLNEESQPEKTSGNCDVDYGKPATKKKKRELREMADECVKNDAPEMSEEVHDVQKKEKRKKKKEGYVDEAVINRDVTKDVNILNTVHFSNTVSENCDSNDADCGKQVTKKKRKKELKEMEEEEEEGENVKESDPPENSKEFREGEKKDKRKKRKKNDMEEAGNSGDVSNVLKASNEESVCDKIREKSDGNDVAYGKQETKKRKKESNEVEGEYVNENCPEYGKEFREVQRKEKRKNKKKSDMEEAVINGGIINGLNNLNGERHLPEKTPENSDENPVECDKQTTKKKKTKKIKEVEGEGDCVKESCLQEESKEFPEVQKKEKRKNKKKSDLEDVVINGNVVSYVNILNEERVSDKKSKNRDSNDGEYEKSGTKKTKKELKETEEEGKRVKENGEEVRGVQTKEKRKNKKKRDLEETEHIINDANMSNEEHPPEKTHEHNRSNLVEYEKLETKKRKKELEVVEDDGECVTNAPPENTEEFREVRKKEKRKKKKECDVEGAVITGDVNNDLKIMNKGQFSNKISGDTVGNDMECKELRTMKETENELYEEGGDCVKENDPPENGEEVRKKEKRRKKKKSDAEEAGISGDVSDVLKTLNEDRLPDNCDRNDLCDGKPETKKKKKETEIKEDFAEEEKTGGKKNKRKKSQALMEELGSEDVTSNTACGTEVNGDVDAETPRKKRKKSSKEDKRRTDEENECETKTKRKSSSKEGVNIHESELSNKGAEKSCNEESLSVQESNETNNDEAKHSPLNRTGLPGGRVVNQRVSNLMLKTNFKKFKGSNLVSIKGYGIVA